MKAATLRMLAGVTAPLILTGSVQAGFTGITTTSKPNPYGLLVVNVYANFDSPGEDHMILIVGTPNSPLLIEVIGGTFYNSAFGSDRAPQAGLVTLFPSLAFDSFVTIGIKTLGEGGQPGPDENFIFPGFPGVSGTEISSVESGWGLRPFPPLSPQGDPFNPLYFPGDGRVLIGQFSTADGSGIQGTMLVRYAINGISHVTFESFSHVPAPGALWLLGAMGLLGSRRRPVSAVTAGPAIGRADDLD